MDRIDIIKPLQGLRGMAAMMVLVHHFAPTHYNGALGVNLFFVLSGFLLAKLYLSQEFNARQVWRYATARFARVYPLFAAVVLLAGGLNAVYGFDIFGLKSWQIDRNLALLGDNLTIWTIAVEFHFYAIFLVLWWATSKGWLGRYALIALYLAAAIGPFFFFGRIDPLRYLHIFTVGVLVANLTQTHSATITRWSGLALPVAGAAFLLLATTGVNVHQSPVAALLGGLVLYTSVQAPDSFTGRLLSVRPMLWLGEISFGVYLLHRFVQVFFVQATGLAGPSWTMFSVCVPLTFAVSWAVFKLFEDPMRRALRAGSNAAEQRFFDAAKTTPLG